MRAPRVDRAIDIAFLIGLAGVSWLAVFGHRGIALCAGFMALAAALRPALWREGFALLNPRTALRRPLSIAAAAMAAFVLWIAATGLWSPTPGAPLLAFFVLAAVLAAGALVFEGLHAGARRLTRFSALFVLMAAIACAALLFEGISGGYLRAVIPPEDGSVLRFKDMTALGRGVTAMTPLVFPAAVLLRRITGSSVIAAAPAAALFVAAGQFTIFANVIALAAGAGAALLAAATSQRLTLFLIGVAFLSALLAAPFITASIPADAIFESAADGVPASWAMRLAVWQAAGEQALGACFPVGCGADYARAWHGDREMIEVPGSAILLPLMPIHPHNVFVQIWLELGVPGVVFAAIAGAAALAALWKTSLDRATGAALCAVLAASFISVMLEASLWQVWRLAVFALAAFGCAVSYSINKSKQ